MFLHRKEINFALNDTVLVIVQYSQNSNTLCSLKTDYTKFSREGWGHCLLQCIVFLISHFLLRLALTQAFEGGVSIELRLGGALVGGGQLGQVVEGVVEGRRGVVVFASSC